MIILISQNIQIVFVVIIRGNSVPDYPTIEKSIREVIRQTDNSHQPETGSQKSMKPMNNEKYNFL